MPSHRAPELRAPRPTPGPVEPVDTTPTETIALAAGDARALPEQSYAASDPEKRPEPVMSAATLAGAVSGAILGVGGLVKLAAPLLPAQLATLDLQVLADQTSNAILSIGLFWATVGPWITARIKARDKVTPLADPRDATGRPLVPVTTR